MNAFDLQNKFPNNNYHNPTVFWVLIATLLLAAGGAVKMLGKSSDLVSRLPTTPSVSEEIRQPRFYNVSYRNGVFSPTNLRIKAGDTVRFKNEGFFSIHVASDPNSTNNKLPGFDSVGDIPQGSYFSYTFAEKGIFDYYNIKKPEERGTIIVR